MGVIYCAGCGAKLELSDVDARIQAIASVQHENWERAFNAINRALFVFALFLVGALLFRGYARRPITADFGACAPLPPPPAFALAPSLIPQAELPLPVVAVADPLKPEKEKEADILADLALIARDRLNCKITFKTVGGVSGVLFSRSDDEIRVVVDWGPPVRVRTIKIANIDMNKSQLPE